MKTEVIQLDILSAIEERDKGMAKAESAVDEVWKRDAIELVKEFLNENQGEFMVEDIRAFAAMKNFVAPASNRVWGPLIKRAEKAGLVRGVDLGITKNKKAHRARATVWISNLKH